MNKNIATIMIKYVLIFCNKMLKDYVLYLIIWALIHLSQLVNSSRMIRSRKIDIMGNSVFRGRTIDSNR